ncbi:UNVERIFIED_CONTAM: hypothetical protein Sradi_7151100 [Sesamum radiatum]|uniref:Reverse transcriptase zinc-binding domain-containing protein n=1 Tax=Sesamum radiatum TaxID=300843 RepID=A0AAW2IVW7_SESRA
MGSDCVLWPTATLESHDHLFFRCQFASACVSEIRRMIHVQWPYTTWETFVLWASRRWRGKHDVNAANRALMASLVYHLWQERNYRTFKSATRSPRDIATMIVREIRELIISKELLKLMFVSLLNITRKPTDQTQQPYSSWTAHWMAVMKSTILGWVLKVPSRGPREWASRVLLRLALRVAFIR